jgi:hypothetical protein
MRDGFLASMVAQFKKRQSRLSVTPTGSISRPPSSISYISPSYSSTPISSISIQEINPNNHDQSGSERSTPQSSSVLQQPITTRSLVAKCQSCNIRGELIVCSHCDNVICVKCADEHQSVINGDVKREWDICKTKFETINEQSSMSVFFFERDFYWIFVLVRFDNDEDEVNNKARNLQTFINKQSSKLIQTVENHKNVYIDMIEKHRRTYKQS